ncbi:hypothetical protein F7725_028877 [Dissostichus mawsoni]|uniref:Retinoic acid receptor responder protein 2 n=1 Tax=Dissostichus mawsoni TaxID=36200 RepID=A0A7J5XIB3_DISMA|nr:hypothetical protein F7725_028877 [Dissostichus mawsoni]
MDFLSCSVKLCRVGGPLHYPLNPIATDKGKRMAVFLLLLVSSGALFFSSNAQGTYEKLPENYKKGKLDSHAGIQHHFLFFRSITKSDIKPGFEVTYVYHHFYLKATKCPKGTVDSTACQFRNDRPLIDCTVCYKTFREEMNRSQTICSLCPQTGPYRGHEDDQIKSLQHNGLQQWSPNSASIIWNRLIIRMTHLLLSSHTRRKMAAGLLLLFCAGALVYSARAQETYDGLPEDYKQGVDLALEQLNTHAGVHHHFRFLRSLEKSDIQEMRTTRTEHCKKMSYNSGAPTLLASTG